MDWDQFSLVVHKGLHTEKPGINPVFYSNGECLRFLPEKQINKIWGADERDDDTGGDAVRRDDIVTD